MAPVDFAEDTATCDSGGGKSKVAFRSAVSVIAEKRDPDSQKEGDEQQELNPAKPEEKFERKKVRKSTGYPKSLATELRDGTDDEDDAPVPSSVSITATNTTASSTPSSRRSSSILSNGQRKSIDRHKMEGGPDAGALTSWCCGYCYEETAEFSGELLRRQSSVGIGNVVEINDQESDQTWHEEQRHEERWQRIRKRVPTGNPKLMKATSLELLESAELIRDLTDAEDLDMLNRNTLYNSGEGCGEGGKEAANTGSTASPKTDKSLSGVNIVFIDD